MKSLKLVLLFGAVMAASFASAQSISSFQLAQINGVSANQVGNNVTLFVGSAPTLVFNSVTYNITDVFGVWMLDANDDMAATGTSQNGWSYHDNYSGTGGIAGWKTNPNSGIGPNQSLNFSYTSLSGTVEDKGFHIRVAGQLPGGGNTAFFRNDSVPEPATMAVLGVGGLALARRRRRK